MAIIPVTNDTKIPANWIISDVLRLEKSKFSIVILFSQVFQHSHADEFIIGDKQQNNNTTIFRRWLKTDGFSNKIEDFLKFSKSCVEANRIAALTEIDLDNQTQDILHNIEINENYPGDYITQGIALKNIRKKRREAKDIQRITFPVVQWVNQNQKTINELEKLLGSVRKAEKSIAGRIYMNRTKILDELFNDEWGGGVHGKIYYSGKETPKSWTG